MSPTMLGRFRAISMSWVMIAHLYTRLMVLGDARNVLDALKNGEMGFITNGTPSVDRERDKLTENSLSIDRKRRRNTLFFITFNLFVQFT